jgi:hypothetical protein
MAEFSVVAPNAVAWVVPVYVPDCSVSGQTQLQSGEHAKLYKKCQLLAFLPSKHLEVSAGT